ncbi:MAG TPA: hypothetical protein VGR51_06405, partial [Thermoplasmata archaeon]|nr:hypothetical protein [Thermoplasmata archaeon]
FTVAFDESLAGGPSVLLAGVTNLTATDASFDGRTWRATFEIPEGADGAYELVLSDVWDRPENRQAELLYPYTVDTTPPRSRAFIAAIEATGPFDVTWDATDSNGSGIARIELWTRADGGPWAVLATSTADRGTHRYDPGVREAVFDFFALAVDRAGNRETEPALPDATIRYDPSPPTASLLPVGAYWFRAPLSLNAIASDDVASADLRVLFARDNATWQGPFSAGNATPPFAWTFAWPLGPGHYRLSALGRSSNGQTEREQAPEGAEVALAYDAEVPVSRVEPSSPYWRSSSIVVSVNASDDRSGIVRVSLFYAFRLNESVPWSPWTATASRTDGPWSFPFDFPMGDGRYELAARGTDRAGNAESLPPIGEGEWAVGCDRVPPTAPTARVIRFVDAANARANVTWSSPPIPDLARFEIHRGATPAFVPDGQPCPISATCVAELPEDARTAWVPVPASNATVWFRVRAVDDGGLAADSAAFGASLHGPGYDTPSLLVSAAPLPIGVAWSESLQYAGGCTDCADAFRVALNATTILDLVLAVPATGDFRLVLYDGNGVFVTASARPGLGAWESLGYEVTIPGIYYVVVDWGGVPGPGNRNEGWYTLSGLVR